MPIETAFVPMSGGSGMLEERAICAPGGTGAMFSLARRIGGVKTSIEP